MNRPPEGPAGRTPAPARSLVHEFAFRAERLWDGIKSELGRPPEKLTVVPYLGHGTRARVVLRGRVLDGDAVTPATGPEPIWRRVRRMAARFETDEVPGVTLRVSMGPNSEVALSDEEGYFRAELTDVAPAPERLFHPLEIEVTSHGRIPAEIGEARVMIPTPHAERLVVSDIDDTVLETGAMRQAQMVARTVTGSVWTRSWFAGVAELYRGLTRGADLSADNPIFYVSSSPWNLYDFLIGFIRRSALPLGPIFLRDLGIDERRFLKESHDLHKRKAIDEILAIHDLPLVLVGDTGQRDPEIYLDIALAAPERVDAVLLRHVAGKEREKEIELAYREVDVPMCMGSDSAELAAFAEGKGLIPPGWADRVSLVSG